MKRKVYLSSTFEDLKSIRNELILKFSAGLNKHFELCEIMEKMYDSGESKNILDICFSAIDDCDIFIQILSGKVGSKPFLVDKSFLECEIGRAREKGKRVFIFEYISDDPEKLNTNPNYVSLKAKIVQGKFCKSCKDFYELYQEILNKLLEIALDPIRKSIGNRDEFIKNIINKIDKEYYDKSKVPYFFIQGPSGSGKTQLSKLIVNNWISSQEFKSYYFSFNDYNEFIINSDKKVLIIIDDIEKELKTDDIKSIFNTKLKNITDNSYPTIFVTSSSDTTSKIKGELKIHNRNDNTFHLEGFGEDEVINFLSQNLPSEQFEVLSREVIVELNKKIQGLPIFWELIINEYKNPKDWLKYYTINSDHILNFVIDNWIQNCLNLLDKDLVLDLFSMFCKYSHFGLSLDVIFKILNPNNESNLTNKIYEIVEKLYSSGIIYSIISVGGKNHYSLHQVIINFFEERPKYLENTQIEKKYVQLLNQLFINNECFLETTTKIDLWIFGMCLLFKNFDLPKDYVNNLFSLYQSLEKENSSVIYSENYINNLLINTLNRECYIQIGIARALKIVKFDNKEFCKKLLEISTSENVDFSAENAYRIQSAAYLSLKHIGEYPLYKEYLLKRINKILLEKEANTFDLDVEYIALISFYYEITLIEQMGNNGRIEISWSFIQTFSDSVSDKNLFKLFPITILIIIMFGIKYRVESDNIITELIRHYSIKIPDDELFLLLGFYNYTFYQNVSLPNLTLLKYNPNRFDFFVNCFNMPELSNYLNKVFSKSKFVNKIQCRIYTLYFKGYNMD